MISVAFHIACIAAHTEEGERDGSDVITYASSLKAFKIPRKQDVSAFIQVPIMSRAEMVSIRDISAS